MKRNFKVSVAEREKLKFCAMYMGATGSGKTLGALVTAKGLVKAAHPELEDTGQEFWDKIGVVDTEHNRSKIYANTSIGGEFVGQFKHIEFEAPYDVDSYIEAVNYLKDLGCEVVIIDSATPAWDDAGGILEVHNNLGGQFATWQKVNPIVKKFYQALTADQSIHIITTVRSKIKYEASQTETGKMKVSKIGLKPIMRDDFEYEVLTALHFDEDHKVSVVKDNTHIFEEDKVLNASYGEALHAFLETGVDIQAKREALRKSLVNELEGLLKKLEKNPEAQATMNRVKAQAERKYGITDWKDLPTPSLENVLATLKEIK